MKRRSIFAMTAILAATSASAHIYEVTTTEDAADDGQGIIACHIPQGGCSLRAAIMKSNQVDEANIIRVPAGIYTLTIPPSGANGDDVGDLNITHSVVITGSGAGVTIIDGNFTDRVVDIAVGQFVSLSNMTIRHGSRRGNGAGIHNAGIATLLALTIEANSASPDATPSDGGGIWSSGSLDIYNSTIIGNVVDGLGGGGGIAASGPVVIRRSTIAYNYATNGAGIDLSGASPYMYLINSTVSGNGAGNNGGGIYNVSTTGNIVGLYSSSIIGNDASHDDDHIGQGGGVYAPAASGVRFLIVNTILGDNTINQRDAFNDCVGSVEAYGFNLFSLAVPPACTIGGNGSDAWGQIFLPSIGPLQDNQGPTFTHALLQNSEAINAATSQGCIDMNGSALDTDQRGAPRIFGFACDIGAFEYGAVVDEIFKDGFNGFF